MNVVDENVPESQRALLRRKRVAVRQIGQEVGRKSMKDAEIVSLLHRLDRPTFFTLDGDYYNRRLCHEGYCLVHLDVDEDQVADYVRRVLRHRTLNTRAKRMSWVIRALLTGLTYWRLHDEEEGYLSWD